MFAADPGRDSARKLCKPVSKRRTKTEHPNPTTCLAIDMIGSTAFGLALDSRKLRLFNQCFVEQIGPHLERLQLRHAILKFTGDGWLVVSDAPGDTIPLACLAQVMASTFSSEMRERTGFERVPALKIAMCMGHDDRVTLPNGAEDFVGDSARRANRLSQIGESQEVLVCAATKLGIARDFEIRKLDEEEIDERISSRGVHKWEEDIDAYRVVGPKDNLSNDSDPALVYLLLALGRIDEASALSAQVSESVDESPDWARRLSGLGLERYVSALSIDSARSLLEKAQRLGVRPTAEAFNSLLTRARDWAKVLEIELEMERAQVPPDPETFHAIMGFAPDWPASENILRKMLGSGVEPDSKTLKLLIEKAPDWPSLERTVELLREAGVRPSPEVFAALIARAPRSARSWLLAELEASRS